MGAANFMQGNTSCIYAVENEYEGIWDDTCDNIAYELAAIERQKGRELGFSWYADDSLDVNNKHSISHPSTSIGRLWSDVSVEDDYVEVQVTLKTVSGYYEGFTLDFEYSLVYACNDYECVEDFIDDIRRCPEDFGYESISEKELKELEDVLQSKLDTLIQIAEEAFKMHSTPLGVYAKFSNGETWYSPCESV